MSAVASMMPPTINVVIFREGDFWVAQCLEYDIAAQAKSLRDLQYEIQRTLAGLIITATEAKEGRFEHIAPAPKRYWEMFATAYALEYEHHPFRVPLGHASPRAELRVSA
jgi:hypothetical protein